MNKEELIGYHKGAIATLIKEKEGLTGLINLVNKLLSAHIEELKKLGVDITKEKDTKEKDKL